MSSGAEHYAEAERLLGNARLDQADEWRAELWIREAQVRATLAQAAATATSVPDGVRTLGEESAWREVLGG